MRLIDADELSRNMETAVKDAHLHIQATVEQYIDCAPTIDPESLRAHGRWEHLGVDEWSCTYCGHVISTEGSWEVPENNYCPNCGAKMDLEVDNG